jgi:UDP-N-acetylmuramyl-tripeptide synthetase
VYNILTAVGVATAMAVPLATIKAGIENLQGVPGRLERVNHDGGFAVFVDYAHTPDALENVLRALKSLTAGRLITIFGCGGDRDRTKRPVMGMAAGQFSDLCVLTSDNPRTENPEAILGDIERGIAQVQDTRFSPGAIADWTGEAGYTIEPNRRRGIALGISAARGGDTVIIAGKGHEPYQIIGDKTLPFDDRIEAERVLGKLSGHSKE